MNISVINSPAAEDACSSPPLLSSSPAEPRPSSPFSAPCVYSGLAGVLLFIALFWGFTYWVQKKVATYEQSQTESHNRFVSLLVQILIHTAKIDGQITREEIQTIHRFFQHNLHYNQTQMHWVKELIKEAINSRRRSTPC